MKYSISIIGSGRVATQLSVGLAPHLDIKQIFSQNLAHARLLADKVKAEAIDDLAQLKIVDLLIISINDSAIETIAQKLKHINYTGLIVHTSGSTDIKVLLQQQLRSAVLYPLQTFSIDQSVDWSNIPIFIEVDRSEDFKMLNEIANFLSERIYHYNSKQRLSLHLAAVFACNFSNYCYDIAQQILDEQSVDFSLLMPLIQETTRKLDTFPASRNQTGPARRQDENILHMHEQMLSGHEEWQKIYRMMSQAIMRRHIEK